ncbi:hypothetical protein CNMCM7691_006462 [Aspergillus felis]|uniref:CorA-like transporter domain-containing protein n=1 Tax=Aspergillus felis TaxID=1287682 RepID=A0A8H6QL82_9EURO|nr:hypothetical protein CNMCM7691_006462 [Aspergillus felis]
MATGPWAEYFASLTQNQRKNENVRDMMKRLRDRSKSVFVSNDAISVRITDVYQDGEWAQTTLYNKSEEITLVLENDIPVTSDTRIISIYSENSIMPLMISEDLMGIVMLKHHVHPSFLSVLLSFGEDMHISEAASTHAMVSHMDTDASFYVSYQLHYVEENHREGPNPWSFRRTGIYHHHTPKRDVIILLHPNETSVLDVRLLELLGLKPSINSRSSDQSNHSVNSLLRNPASLHSLVMSTFSGNWRWFLRHLGYRFEPYNDRAFGMTPEKLTPQESFNHLVTLRNLNDWVNKARASCEGTLDLVLRLKDSFHECNEHEPRIRSYIQSCDGLTPRVRNTTDLLGFTLNLHNQLETAKIDRELRDITEQLQLVTSELKDLQRDNIDDSAAVKIITFISAVYLPGSFIVVRLPLSLNALNVGTDSGGRAFMA